MCTVTRQTLKEEVGPTFPSALLKRWTTVFIGLVATTWPAANGRGKKQKKQREGHYIIIAVVNWRDWPMYFVCTETLFIYGWQV